jgi:hypothetical protein
MKKTAPFRYTFPILKAEQREDGRYITGEASGPEIDATNERMSPECIVQFAQQITDMAAAGTPLVYRDAHASDGVLRDLGEITRAWVDDRTHMGIEVKLEDGNPAADWLFNSITTKKRKWGMSIAGMVKDYADEFVAEVGKVIRTYKDVILTEISNTTRPAWTPSFGTVLSKAIDEATAESEGENVDEQDTLQAGEQAASSDAVAIEDTTDTTDKSSAEATDEAVVADESLGDDEAPVTDKAVADEAAADETADTEKSSEAASDAVSIGYSIASLVSQLGETDDPATIADLKAAIALLQGVQSREIAAIGTPEDTSASRCGNCGADVAMSATEDVDVEKAGRPLSAANAKRLLALRAELDSFLGDLGVTEEPAKSDSSDAEPDLIKSWEVEKTDLTTKITELERSLTEKTARVAELEAMPATQAPALVRSEEPGEQLAKAIDSMSPQERMRFGLTLKHQ